MKRISCFLPALVTMLLAAQVQAASIYRLDATAIPDAAAPSYWVSDFWLTFEDKDGDLIFTLGELQSFSGVTWITGGNPPEIFFDEIGAVADIPGIAAGMHSLSPDWVFLRDLGSGFIGQNELWQYERNYVAEAVVPLPAAGLLLGGALLLMRLRRRA